MTFSKHIPQANQNILISTHTIP